MVVVAKRVVGAVSGSVEMGRECEAAGRVGRGW